LFRLSSTRGLSCVRVMSMVMVYISLVFWLIVGGTLVLYMLLNKAMRFDKYDDSQTPELEEQYIPVNANEQNEITETPQVAPLSEHSVEGPQDRGQIGQFKVFRIGLLIWTLYGASCVMADGLLTPAVSVVSAVNGCRLNLYR